MLGPAGLVAGTHVVGLRSTPGSLRGHASFFVPGPPSGLVDRLTRRSKSPECHPPPLLDHPFATGAIEPNVVGNCGDSPTRRRRFRSVGGRPAPDVRDSSLTSKRAIAVESAQESWSLFQNHSSTRPAPLASGHPRGTPRAVVVRVFFLGFRTRLRTCRWGRFRRGSRLFFALCFFYSRRPQFRRPRRLRPPLPLP